MNRVRLFVLLVVAVLVVAAPAAHGTSQSLVVSQVYAGGGNSGAVYANDFVELLNRGSTAIDVGSWTLQYASAGSTSWQVIPLSGTIQPGRYYLVGLASSGSVGSALPAADASGSANLAVAGGKVAIVHDTSSLSCGGTPGSCSAVPAVADLVGYGTAADYEGAAAAPAVSATLADARAGAGCTDTDDNGTDLATAAPSPRNSASPAAACGSGSPSSASQDASVDLDLQAVLSLSLEHSSLSFGNAAAGDTPAALGDRLTVVSNSATGYALTVHRSVFTPADLPLAISTTAPAGGTLGSGVSGNALTRVPVVPAADLLVGTTSARSAANGDVWPATIGFATALPIVPPGHYAATVTFTVVGR